MNPHGSPSTGEPLAPTRNRLKKQTRSKNPNWTENDDRYLTEIVQNNPIPQWPEIAMLFPGKTSHQVADRWTRVLNPNLVKGSWTREEDAQIIQYVNMNGPRHWGSLAELLPGRISKQCRERWHNHLCPNVNKNDWTPEEDQILIDRQKLLGNKWSQIALDLPGRTDNAVKNRWNSSLKRRLERIKNGESPSGKRGRKPKRQSDAPEILESQKGQMAIISQPIPTQMINQSMIISNMPIQKSQNKEIDDIPKPNIEDINMMPLFKEPSSNSSALPPFTLNGTPSITPLVSTPILSPSLQSPATPGRFIFSPGWSPIGSNWTSSLSPYQTSQTVDKNSLVEIPGPKFD